MIRKEYRKKYFQTHKKEREEYRRLNKEKVKRWNRKFYLSHREKIIEQVKKYFQKHEEQKRKYYKLRARKLRENPRFRLDINMSRAILHVLEGQKANRRWEDLVGYKIEYLIKHLENQFNNKMTWNNYGSYWHIDHIKPKSLFKYQIAEDPEFRPCWALENLQPLEKGENYRKHNNWTDENLTKVVT